MVPPLKDETMSCGCHDCNGAISMTTTMTTTKKPMVDQDLKVSFSHVQLYVDHIDDMELYKELEQKMNRFSEAASKAASLEEKRSVWKSMSGDTKMDPFVTQNRDVIKQLIVGFGFRVTAYRFPSEGCSTNSRSVLVTSEDLRGVQLVVTAIDEESGAGAVDSSYHHFDAGNVRRFLQVHSNRQGFSVLGFATNNVDVIYQKYKQLHPKLIHDFSDYQNKTNKVLEVYAYYTEGAGGNAGHEKEADTGTILRFIESQEEPESASSFCLLPGLTKIDATFDGTSQAAYCDHWVSNVISRTGFLSTLEDTLGFTPKVDFNAGVVAAGEAQIESTVTGNDTAPTLADKADALRDQSQVYLPINNALSDVGHVHGFLKEIGQGIQHVASRVENLVDFVQRGNDYREITGEGFTFLNIPRSYYGVLSEKDLMMDTGISMECAESIMLACFENGVAALDGAVDLSISPEAIATILEASIPADHVGAFQANRVGILDTVLKSRYKNLHSLLKEHVSVETYMGIVNNQILVDVQGEDLLYQIFTSNILQRNVGEEAPFFEFIQRVCSECADENGCPLKVKPGCGGFGIRNFLTLFLSIELSKAMLEASEAKLAGDERLREYAQNRVDCFTSQLGDSNPILTEISDAMTLEGHCKEQMELAEERNDTESMNMWKRKKEAAGERKSAGNVRLMDCSARYKTMMRSIREAGV